MGIKDTFTSFIDNVGLAETFKLKPYDAEKARKPLLTGIAEAKRQSKRHQTR